MHVGREMLFRCYNNGQIYIYVKFERIFVCGDAGLSDMILMYTGDMITVLPLLISSL